MHEYTHPKRDWGNYLESEAGILVPKRDFEFNDLKRTDIDVMARTEHPQDYAGSSNLFQTPYVFDWNEFSSEQKFRDAVLQQSSSDVEEYARLTGQSVDEVTAGFQLSYWEKIPGENVKICRDNTKHDLYHIIFPGEIYLLTEGTTPMHTPDSIEPIEHYIPDLISLYDKVNAFSDATDCPIVEAQCHQDQVYFLQVHKGTPKIGPASPITRHAQPGEVEALLVRGNLEKTTLSAGMHYAGRDGTNLHYTPEQAGFDFHFNDTFTELQLRHRTLHIMVQDSIAAVLRKLGDHISASEFFKTPVAVVISNDQLDKLVSEYEQEQMCQASRNSQDQYISLNVEADGNRAILSRA